MKTSHSILKVGRGIDIVWIDVNQITPERSLPYRHWPEWCIALADIVQCRSSWTFRSSSSRDVFELHRLVQLVSTNTTHEQIVKLTRKSSSNYVISYCCCY